MGPQSCDCGNIWTDSQTRASMGPQSCDCGNNTKQPSTSTSLPSFNGAAVFRLRKLTGWTFERDPDGDRFNGAAVLRLRKPPNAHQIIDTDQRASMGPQSFDCGNSLKASQTHVWFDACFNGAAVFRLRKQQNASALPDLTIVLQWGRSLSTAETRHARILSVPRRCASMGPQSFDCGNDRASYSRRSATAMLQWGRSLSTAETPTLRRLSPNVSHASMGPQSFDCGNVRVAARTCIRTRSGFNGAAVFRLRKPAGCRPSGNLIVSASMGPQSFDCGNSATLRRLTCSMPSFNGAAVFRLRKLSLPVSVYARRTHELQWGRSLSTAETAAARASTARQAELQWGRSLSTAETSDRGLTFREPT